jgi:peptidoglycan hydrolase-like protein with peptidoglycan-binding domain
MPTSYLESTIVLRRGAIDATGAANYPRASQNTPEDLVTQLQRDLKSLGYLMGAVDGAFGEGTERAVKKFERDQRLPDKGEIGPEDKAALGRAMKAGKGRDEALSYDHLRGDVTSLDYKWDDAPGWINLIGVRGFWHGETVANTFNVYNDTIVALWIDQLGKKHVELFDASCDPGRCHEPAPNGVAHLVEGQYLFSRGLHHGQYRALRQAIAVRVKRYFDDDPNRLRPQLDEGFFGINIHCGGISNEVNDWSAGCQIVKGGRSGEPWTRFDKLIYETAPADQLRFRYSLIRGESLSDR